MWLYQNSEYYIGLDENSSFFVEFALIFQQRHYLLYLFYFLLLSVSIYYFHETNTALSPRNVDFQRFAGVFYFEMCID